MKNISKIFSLVIIFSLIFYLPAHSGKDAKVKALKGFDKFVNSAMKDWKVPGLAVAIVQDRKLIFAEGFGFRNVDQNLPVTSDTLFAIGSCTKAFTATALGILADEGKLKWDEKLNYYLPSFKLKDKFASARFTPRDLVCHRSGLPRHDATWYNATATRKELFSRLQYLEPSADFRTTYQYQNLMFMTAGYLIEQITGKTWEKFIRLRFFEPLGMNNSNFSVEDSKKARDFALPYMEKDDKIVKIPFRNIDTIGPAGSINSSVMDMAGWLLLNLKKGKVGDKQIISENSLKEIHTPQMISSKNFRYDENFYSMYAMGWGITAYRGHLLLSHGGGIDGFTASVSFMPRDNMGMVILTNKSGTPIPGIVLYNAYDRLLGLKTIDWNQRIRERTEKAKKEAEKAQKDKDKDRKTNTKTSHPLADFTGEYKNPGYGIFAVKQDGKGLKAVFNNIDYTMRHYHYDIFEIKNEMLDMKQKISFSTDLKGNITVLSIQLEPAVEAISFTRMADKKMKEHSFLKKFVGEYEYNNITVSIFFKGETNLFLRVPGQPEYELEPYKNTEFQLKGIPGISIEFVVDETGKVSEAIITQPEGVFHAQKK